MIAIYNLEPKLFNLALEKVKKYYEDNISVFKQKESRDIHYVY